MRSPKKTVSLFQSHVFKHEFFLLESCLFPVPSELVLYEHLFDFYKNKFYFLGTYYAKTLILSGLTQLAHW
jgi:hypothetical protein